MNWILPLLNALAWPISALVIAFLFRREMKMALGRLGQVKYRDFEMTFRDDLHQAEALARSIPGKPEVGLELGPGEMEAIGGRIIGGITPTPALADDRDALARLAASSPRDAVGGAWAVVGRSLIRAAMPVDRRMPAPVDADDAVRLLVDRGRLAGPEAQLVNLLRSLRDRAARPSEPSPSPEEARRFVDLALQVASRVEGKG